MLEPASGPYLFDTSAERWFAKQSAFETRRWLLTYLSHHPIQVSSITVFERVRGYALLWQQADEDHRREIEMARLAYLDEPNEVWPVNKVVATLGAEICALIPQPPTPPKRGHKAVESRQGHLARWRTDIMIAATSLSTDMLLGTAAGRPVVDKTGLDGKFMIVLTYRPLSVASGDTPDPGSDLFLRQCANSWGSGLSRRGLRWMF